MTADYLALLLCWFCKAAISMSALLLQLQVFKESWRCTKSHHHQADTIRSPGSPTAAVIAISVVVHCLFLHENPKDRLALVFFNSLLTFPYMSIKRCVLWLVITKITKVLWIRKTPLTKSLTFTGHHICIDR